MTLSQDEWKRREEKTKAIIKVLNGYLLTFKREYDRELRMWWFFENYPPKFRVFFKFDGYSSVTDTMLNRLEPIITRIAVKGLSKSRKFIDGNEVSYQFWLPMESEK